MANWIAGATSKHKGVFKAKAKAAGMSTRAFAEKHKGAPGTLGKQARLALTLMGVNGSMHGDEMKKPGQPSKVHQIG